MFTPKPLGRGDDGGRLRPRRSGDIVGEARGFLTMRPMFGLITVTALALWCAVGPLRAADWPTKPVRIIVPFAPGGAADASVRRYVDALGNAFGKPFIIENRPGGGGIPAAEAVARAE